MKKITLFLMMLLSISAFSQIEIVENFETTANNGVPAGWIGGSPNFRAGTTFNCDASKSVYAGVTAGGSASLTTPNYPAISNGTGLTVSFTYNIYEQDTQFPPVTFSGPATDWGSLILEYTTDGANWTPLYTISDANYNYVDRETCASYTDNFAAIANGSDFQARFVLNATNVNGVALIAVIDNISITQVATTAPNCNVTLTNPLNGSTTADTDVTLNWQTATGIPTGYTVSVGTTSGGTDIVNAATTTSTNFPLNGLIAYETQYYVNIIPYNGVGSATGCTEQSFTTRVAPIPGASCSSPLVVATFPYINISDTALYENNVNTGSCGPNNTSYMLGKDVFYQITPAMDMSINIDLTGINNTGAGMHLMKGCPTDVDKVCIGFDFPVNGADLALNISEATLLAGNTYFLVLSNSGSTRTYAYNLIITQNTCINPEFTFTNVPDCGNGQFSIDADITYLGDATSLTLSDNFGNSFNNVNLTGIVNIGPYAAGSVVDLTLTTNTAGQTCFSEILGIYYYCPPVNDDCGNAIDLTSTINTDGTCTLFTSATNAGATNSVGDPAACSGNTNDVWFSFVANGSTMIAEFLNVINADGTPGGGSLQSVELLEGNCGALTSLGCYNGGIAGYIEFHGLTDGNTYYIRDKSSSTGEYAQNFDICLKTPPAPPVNDECANATTLTLSTSNTCDNQISGTTTGATISVENTCNTSPSKDVWYVFTPNATAYHEFQFTRIQTSPSSNYTIFEGTCNALTQKSSSCTNTGNQIFNLTSGQSYYILVRSANTGPTSGIDFSLCVWQLPPAQANSDCSNPAVLQESPDNTGANTISGNLDNAYNSPEGCSSATYESVWYSFTPQYSGAYYFNFTRSNSSTYFSIYNTDNCANTSSAGYVAGSCYNTGTASITGNVVAGETYLIMVHGTVAANFTLFAYPDPSLGVADSNFELFKYYPNPVNSTLTLEARNTISNVSVYNIVGQKIQSIDPNNLEAKVDMNKLSKGVYFITVTINNSQKTFRVIKD